MQRKAYHLFKPSFWTSLCALTFFSFTTIEDKEKKFSSMQDGHTTQDLLSINEQLKTLKEQVALIYQKADPALDSAAQIILVEEVNQKRKEIAKFEKLWQESASTMLKNTDSPFAYWDMEETTLSQLVIEYGSQDYLYIVPPDLSAMKIHLHSMIPIPRESWSEILEILLTQNGIGIKKISPYVRQLYQLKQEPSAVALIATSAKDLALIAPQERVLFILSPPVEQLKGCFHFFEKFIDQKQVSIQIASQKLILVATAQEASKLLSLYEKIWEEGKGKISRVVTVSKMPVKEMEKILQSFFGDAMEKPRPPFAKGTEQEGIHIIPSTSANNIVLIGQKELVERAEKVIRDTEEQLQNPSEMTVFLYQCKHSDPGELAQILQKVYVSLLSTVVGGETAEVTYSQHGAGSRPPADGYQASPPLVIQPQPLRPGFTAKTEVEYENERFIPDPKTGSILMAVRKDTLFQIKELLRKIDIPKKMVQIEVLLFEKKLRSDNNFGLNLLRLGSSTNFGEYTSLFAPDPAAKGVLEFFFSGKKSKHFPAFDITYSFLMTQEDIQLNAAPSVVTVNQTPATITIQDEISINNGAAPVDTNKGTSFEKSFTRQQYGINILITPFIHNVEYNNEEESEKGFVTLQTDITFDSPKGDPDNDRPRVERRHVKNEVRVADGQTVILGGLRKKTTHDNAERVPFLGEIPGLGKLFGSTRLIEDKTEMFIFITPKIILDPEEQLTRFRNEEIKKRPGDVPEFLQKVIDARNKEKNRYFRKSLKVFFGPP